MYVCDKYLDEYMGLYMAGEDTRTAIVFSPDDQKRKNPVHAKFQVLISR